jgi:hypothetical protein
MSKLITHLIQGLINNQPYEFHIEIIEDFDAHTVTTKFKTVLTNITQDKNNVLLDVTKPTRSECIDEVILFAGENNIEFSEDHLESIRRDQPVVANFLFEPPLK